MADVTLEWLLFCEYSVFTSQQRPVLVGVLEGLQSEQFPVAASIAFVCQLRGDPHRSLKIQLVLEWPNVGNQ